MADKVRWGIISTAKIGLTKVIPAMQQAENVEVVAIASRSELSAKSAAERLGIPKSYGDYESVLNDPKIDAIYNPLPNHLHFEWTRKAIIRNKHVLCEKPLSLKSAEIMELVALRDTHKVCVGEAFMVDSHPQWLEARRLVHKGELGIVTAINGFFSYHQVDPKNIRNRFEYGGGAIWDIGCYPVHLARFMLGEEPLRVFALIDRDPQMKTDRHVTAILDFADCQCSFTVSTQLVPHQRMMFLGDKKKLEIEIPFNAPNDRACKIFLDSGNLLGEGRQEMTFNKCDQYQLQAQQFSHAIVTGDPVPVSLEEAYKNCRVLEALFQSDKEQGWIQL